MVTDDEASRALLARGLVDWVSLHDVVWYSTGGQLDERSKRRTSRVLRQLFDEDLMVPGELGEDGFEDWSYPHSSWYARACSELDGLHWSPIGDGFWLRLTEKGRRAASTGE